MANTILSILTILVILVWIGYAFRKRPEESDLDRLGHNLDDLVIFTKKYFKAELSARYTGRKNYEEARRDERRKQIKLAAKDCMHGKKKSKMLILSFIRNGISKAYQFTNESIDLVIPFSDESKLTTTQKFHIMLYWYKVRLKKGDQAFNSIVKKYDLVTLRDNPYSQTVTKRDGTVGKREKSFIILDKDIEYVWGEEKDEIHLDLGDKIQLVTQAVYAKTHGLGVIDELIDQDIDGVNGGTGGLPSDVEILLAFDDDGFTGPANEEYRKIHRDYDHVRIFWKGLPVHLDFMSMESEAELKRLTEILYSYAPVGQLNKRNGYKISERADKSRVVVTSPNLTDSYAFFVRKFSADLVDIDTMFTNMKNWEMIVWWMDLLAKGGITTAFTGAQGTGKTTLMRAAMALFEGFWNVRIQEGSAFELWARKTFPWKAFLSFKETEMVPGEEGLTVQKKTDGHVNLVGEAAEDKVIGWIMKTAGVASIFTWFTHHANTVRSLVDACRDAMINCGFSNDVKSAEAYVVRVLFGNLHLVNILGVRYMQRFSEIVPIEEEDYPEDYKKQTTLEKKLFYILDNWAEYMRRRTSTKFYTTHDIFVCKGGEYIANHRPTDRFIEKMREQLRDEDQKSLDKFLDHYFPLEDKGAA